MKAYEYIRYGGPEVLRLADQPDPEGEPTEIIVDVRAVGLNPIDVLQREGAFRFANPGRFPLVPGNEFSGTVSSVGSEVYGVAVGDAVYARTDKARLGALAERVAIRADLVAPMPRSTDFTTAAAIPLAGSTALQSIRGALAVGPGDSILITAGSSMVGMLAIQLAAHHGARVAVTASAVNASDLTSLGAEEVFDYHRHPDAEIPGTYTKILDLVPGADLRALLDRLRPGGRLVSVAATPTPGSIRHDYEMSAGRAVVLEAALAVITARVRRYALKNGVHYQRLSMRPDGTDLRTLAELVDDGALSIPIDSRFPFPDAAAAFARVESRRAKGKVVVEIDAVGVGGG